MRRFSYQIGKGSRLREEKKMSKSSVVKGKQKSVSGTVNSSLDQISDVLVSEFSKVIGGSLPAEFKVFEKAVKMIEAKKVGYRGIAKSIEKANEVGALPTIKPSHAQDFVSASQIRTLEGGATQSLKVLLNTAIQARKYFNGKDGKMPLAEALEFVASFDDLKASIPSQGEQKAKRSARTEGDKVEKEAKPATLEQIIKALGSELKKKPVLKGQALKDAEAVAFLLAQALERSRVTLKVA
jgi:hypothetical protein